MSLISSSSSTGGVDSGIDSASQTTPTPGIHSPAVIGIAVGCGLFLFIVAAVVYFAPSGKRRRRVAAAAAATGAAPQSHAELASAGGGTVVNTTTTTNTGNDLGQVRISVHSVISSTSFSGPDESRLRAPTALVRALEPLPPPPSTSIILPPAASTSVAVLA